MRFGEIVLNKFKDEVGKILTIGSGGLEVSTVEISAYALTSEVADVSAGIDNRLTTVEGDVTNLFNDPTLGQVNVTSVNSITGAVSFVAGENVSISGSGDDLVISANLSGAVDTITNDILASQAVGAIDAGETITTGTTLQEFAEALLLETFFPTFTNRSLNLTENISNNQELGTILNVTLTANFNRGAINGDLVGGVWNAGTKQDDRVGAATLYTIDGTNNGTNSSLVVSNYQVTEGTNTWSATVDYGVGPQPLDSDGNNFDSPASAGSVSDTVSINGRRRAFYAGDNVSSVAPIDSAEVRALGDNLLNPQNNSTFTIDIPVGASRVVFAYPANLPAVETVKYVEGLNAEVKNIFTETTVSVAGANNFSPTNYRVYTYVPAVPFDATATYDVTI